MWKGTRKDRSRTICSKGKRKCSGCSEIIDEKNEFCPNCGAKKEVAAEEKNEEKEEIKENISNDKKPKEKKDEKKMENENVKNVEKWMINQICFAQTVELKKKIKMRKKDEVSNSKS